MSNRQALLVCLALFALLLSHQPKQQSDNALHSAKTEAVEAQNTPTEAIPPTPPLRESFDGKPQLSLFPRLGDYRPAETDQQRLSYWETFITHIRKIAGPASTDEEQSNRAWSFRSINSLDAIGWFSPIAIEPATTYRVQLRLKTDLPEGASAGIGILEFKKFIWRSEQYTEEITTQLQSGIHDGVRLHGVQDWQQIDYRFTSGPDSRMIHLVLFREGPHDRKPILFDDISIEVVD